MKIGWITGLILYAFTSVVFTAQQLPDALAGHLGKSMLDQLKASPFQDPTMTSMFQSDPGKAILLLLGAMFGLVTCLSMAGGALGAKLVEARDDRPHPPKGRHARVDTSMAQRTGAESVGK